MILFPVWPWTKWKEEILLGSLDLNSARVGLTWGTLKGFRQWPFHAQRIITTFGYYSLSTERYNFLLSAVCPNTSMRSKPYTFVHWGSESVCLYTYTIYMHVSVFVYVLMRDNHRRCFNHSKLTCRQQIYVRLCYFDTMLFVNTFKQFKSNMHREYQIVPQWTIH